MLTLKRCTILTSCLVSSLLINGKFVMAHDGEKHQVIAVKSADMYRPTAMPDRIILT